MEFLPKKIDDYCVAHTTSEGDILHALTRETHLKTMVPRMLSGHFQGRFLSLISHLMQPKRVLEIGTFTGYSALCLAEGLADDGILYALEGNDELAYLIEKYVEKGGFKDKIKLIIGDALKTISTLEETFDLVFMDAAKRDYPVYYDLVFDKVRSGGLIIADNVIREGKVLLEESPDEMVAGVKRFNEFFIRFVRNEFSHKILFVKSIFFFVSVFVCKLMRPALFAQ